MVETSIFEHCGVNEQQKREMLGQTAASYPMRRPGQPSDVASLCLFVADNEAAGWMTGQLIVLDGGKLLAE